MNSLCVDFLEMLNWFEIKFRKIYEGYFLQVLDYHEVPFKDYNVLENEELRNGIKLYSEWPTIPQVYVKSQFIGGSDILVQMHKEGEITDFFDENGIPSKFSEKFKKE